MEDVELLGCMIETEKMKLKYAEKFVLGNDIKENAILAERKAYNTVLEFIKQIQRMEE
jgi:hypothetical protein